MLRSIDPNYKPYGAPITATVLHHGSNLSGYGTPSGQALGGQKQSLGASAAAERHDWDQRYRRGVVSSFGSWVKKDPNAHYLTAQDVSKSGMYGMGAVDPMVQAALDAPLDFPQQCPNKNCYGPLPATPLASASILSSLPWWAWAALAYKILL